jgi:hypothetical protein
MDQTLTKSLKLIADNMPEKALSENVRVLADTLGYQYYHTWTSIHSARGFPDYVLIKAPRLIFVELKRQAGKVTNAQQEWLDNLIRCNVEVYIWRPSEWLDGTIETILQKAPDETTPRTF